MLSFSVVVLFYLVTFVCIYKITIGSETETTTCAYRTQYLFVSPNDTVDELVHLY